MAGKEVRQQRTHEQVNQADLRENTQRLGRVATGGVTREGWFDRLSPEEEKALASAVKAGDEKARERFIASNMGLVVSIAQRYYNMYGGVNKLPLADLIQEGSVGLMHAVDKFDPELGAFSSYAVRSINWSMYNSALGKTNLIRIPHDMLYGIRRLDRFAHRIEQEQERQASDEELCAELDMAPDDLAEMRRVTALIGHVSLDAPFSRGSTSDEYILEDDRERIDGVESIESVEASVMEETLREAIEGMLASSNLSERERGVIEMRFGLNNSEEYTLARAGEVYGLSRERIRQIEARALRKLRRHEDAHLLREYLD